MRSCFRWSPAIWGAELPAWLSRAVSKKRFDRPIILGGEYWVEAPIYDEIERVLTLGALDYYIIRIWG